MWEIKGESTQIHIHSWIKYMENIHLARVFIQFIHHSNECTRGV